jgi:Transposase IS66 family
MESGGVPDLMDRKTIQLGPFAITPFLVDHSAYDAYALLIEAHGRRLFYSGDIRAHGRKAALFERLVAKPPRPVHAMLMEGSSLGRLDPGQQFPTERAIEAQLADKPDGPRAQAPLVGAAQPLAQAVRTSPVVGSDETSARVGGKTWWQWVLLSSTAIYHVIADTRAAGVVTDFLRGAQPEVWVADRYAGQLGHGAARQMCLAHLLRDANYALEEGCNGFALEFKWLLLRAISIGRRRPGLKDSTLRHYHADLERRLDRLLSRQQPSTPASRRLFKAMRRHRDDLFRFMARRDVPYTNNACERALRPSVIFRKVTGCFRSKWGAQVYAAAASVIATGRLHGLTALQALSNALAGKPILLPP